MIANIFLSNPRNTPSFKASFKSNYVQYLKYAKSPSIRAIRVLKDENVKNLLSASSITIPDVFETISSIGSIFQQYSLSEILSSLNNFETYKFVSQYGLKLSQAPVVQKLSNTQTEAYENALLKLNNPKIQKTKIYELQQDEGYLIEAETEEKYISEFDSYVYFNIKISPQGDCQISRCEHDAKNHSLSRLQNSNLETILNTQDEEEGFAKDVRQIIQITPEYIIESHLSDILKGAYNTTKYDFEVYPEEYDIISALKNNTIYGGQVLCRVIETNDSTILDENFSYQDTQTKRFYKEAKNKTQREYKYQITEGGTVLLNREKSWQKLSDNKTITKVNEKTYTAEFKGRIAIITDSEGNVTTVNFNIKAPDFDIEFLKSLDADTILAIDKYSKSLIIAENRINTYYNSLSENIYTTENNFNLLHELGHAIDFQSIGLSNKKEISKELIETYKKELEAFINNSNSEMQKLVKYFSQTSESTGLDELIAETNAITNTYGSDDLYLSARIHFLIHYFPKTIATASKLLNCST